jgi:transcriptional regulator with XRE-family HTH domain
MITVVRSADPFGRGPGPALADFAHVGQYLRAVREHRGLTLAQVAAETRVRRLYLTALEEGEHGPLPSRPFAVGYVRAYARALALDGDEIVARFRTDFPEDRSPLHAPIGVAQEKDQARRLVYWAGGAVVSAVVLWNVAQRTIINDQPAPGPAFPAAALQSPLPSPGPVQLGAPTPPPADQTVPQPYVTPGLPQTDPAASDPAAQTNGSQPIPVAVATSTLPPGPAQFEAHGQIYGAAAKDGDVIIQAKKRAALIVRGPSGAIYFARQLAAGDAYRVPRGTHATADVSDPAAFDLYVGGKFQSLLTEPLTPLDLAPPASVAVATPAPSAVAPPTAPAPSTSAPTPKGPAPSSAPRIPAA